MRYFPDSLTERESDLLAQRLQSDIATRGWGFWAVEVKLTKQFIGFVGLSEPAADLPCSPCVEIGWRLAKEHWGHGFATEAAQESLRIAFETLNLEQVVSFTATSNKPSIAVMERIGLQNEKEKFMHPRLPEDHQLAEHVLYRLRQSRWRALALVE